MPTPYERVSIDSGATFIKRFLPTVGVNLLMGGIGIITGVLASRWLGPTGRGELAVIQLWPGFLAVAAMMGLPEAMVYFSAKQPERAGRYLSSSLVLGLAASAGVMAVGYWVLPFVLSAQTESAVATTQVYLWFIPITVTLTIGYQSLRGLGRFGVWNVMRILTSLVWLAVLLVAWLTSRTTATFLALGNLVGLTLLLPIVGVVLAMVVRGWTWPDYRTWRPLMQFGLPTVLSAIPVLLNMRLDQLVMAAFLPARSLGLYVVAVTWSTIMSPILTAVGMVLFPQVASMGSQRAQIEMVAMVSRLSAGVSVLLALALGLVTPLGLPLLFGEDFRPAVLPAMILVGAGAIANVNQVLEEGARGLGYPVFALRAEVGGLVATVVGLWFLLQPLGIIGAAIASVLGYTTVTALLLWQLRRSLGPRSGRYLVPTGADWNTLISVVRRNTITAKSGPAAAQSPGVGGEQ